uniref:Family with sequence similarity 117 member Ba n=1 Tax=Oncorhynchus kisutch TaxID=8019 RepID=A0A8C7I2V4_ONCKI
MCVFVFMHLTCLSLWCQTPRVCVCVCIHVSHLSLWCQTPSVCVCIHASHISLWCQTPRVCVCVCVFVFMYLTSLCGVRPPVCVFVFMHLTSLCGVRPPGCVCVCLYSCISPLSVVSDPQCVCLYSCISHLSVVSDPQGVCVCVCVCIHVSHLSLWCQTPSVCVCIHASHISLWCQTPRVCVCVCIHVSHLSLWCQTPRVCVCVCVCIHVSHLSLWCQTPSVCVCIHASHISLWCQTPRAWADERRRGSHKRSASCGSTDQLKEIAKLRQQLQRSKRSSRHRRDKDRRSPFNGSHAAIIQSQAQMPNKTILIPVPKSTAPRFRNSVEGLNQEIERIIIRDTPQLRDEVIIPQDVPDGHRAPPPLPPSAAAPPEALTHRPPQEGASVAVSIATAAAGPTPSLPPTLPSSTIWEEAAPTPQRRKNWVPAHLSRSMQRLRSPTTATCSRGSRRRAVRRSRSLRSHCEYSLTLTSNPNP